MKLIVMLLCWVSMLTCYAGANQPENRTARRLPPAGSGNLKAFAAAFYDPNTVIGVFHKSTISPHTGEYTHEMIGMEQIELFQIMVRLGLRELYPVEIIQGELTEPVVFIPFPDVISMNLPPDSPGVGVWAGPRESEWLVVLHKTTPEHRITRFGEDIDKHKWINDDTLFTLGIYGFGQFCLEWPEDIDRDRPEWVPMVSQDIIEDFQIIGQLTADIQQSRITDEERTQIMEAFATDEAGAIFEKMITKAADKMPPEKEDSQE